MLTLNEKQPKIPQVDQTRRAHPWDKPPRLWSLWEMLNSYARYFCFMQSRFKEICGRLRIEEMDGDTLISVPGPDGSIGWTGLADDEDGLWLPFRKMCEELDLDSAVAQIDRLRAELKSPRLHRSQLRTLIEDLHNRIEDGLSCRYFLYVPKPKVPYWENELYFGEDVAEKIPNAREDIYEACSCFAAGRYSATVYHCVGIMQAAFFQVGEAGLNCTINLDVDDWGSVTRKIEQAVGELEKQAKAQSKDAAVWSKWKTMEPLYGELISDVNAVKKAWRHTSAHFRQTFKEEQASKVLDKVGDFMKTVVKLL
jgi:hypothetical protein